MSYHEILERNRLWVEQTTALDPEYFQRLASEHKPRFLYIGCSDSRVTAEDLMGLQPGQVFIHRNVANLVVSTDNNLNAVVQFAVEQLKVKHIIVCGHYECGGVKAALHPTDMGQLNSWLQTLRDVYRLHRDELDQLTNERERFDRLVELNVLEQCINIIKIDHVQRMWNKNGFPQVHGWVFDVRTGRLKNLGLDMEQIFGEVRSIYDINPPTS